MNCRVLNKVLELLKHGEAPQRIADVEGVDLTLVETIDQMRRAGVIRTQIVLH